MISNTDSTLLIYSTEHMRVKVYTGNPSRRPVIRQTGRGNLPFSRNHHKSLIQMGLFGCLVEAAGVEPVRAQLSSIPYAPGPLPARRVDIAMKGTSFVPNDDSALHCTRDPSVDARTRTRSRGADQGLTTEFAKGEAALVTPCAIASSSTWPANHCFCCQIGV